VDTPSLLVQMDTVRSLLSTLGLGLNLPKSRLPPAQAFTFPGAEFNLRHFTIRPSEERILSLGRCFQDLVGLPHITAQQLARLIGLMDSVADLVPLGQWRVRVLHWFRSLRWTTRWSSQNKDVLPQLPLDDQRIRWWMVPDNLAMGVPIQDPLPDHTIFTDASATGWGAHWNQLQASRVWQMLY